MKRLGLWLLLCSIGTLAACSDGTGGDKVDNQPPTVWLAAGPPEGSTGKYRVQMFWGGWDPDGEIAGYEYLVTDNDGVFDPADTVGVPWSPVAGNDSTFTFSADEREDSLNVQRWTFTRSHTFFIRAIDHEGMRSLQPAYRSFTSRTISPEVRIDIPVRNFLNPARVPPITTFRWRAIDFVDDQILFQEPDSVQWALVNIAPFGALNYEGALEYLRTPAAEHEWYPWVFYRAPQDSGKFWTTPPIDLGRYVFAIRAKDEAGAITPVLDEVTNVRRIEVLSLSGGPFMSLTNEYIGVIRTSSCTTPVTILDSPAGVPLEFKVTASAETYGGTVVGYRYGWDIPDLEDPEQWETDIIPFTQTVATIPARTFFFGTHTLTVEVIDNSGYCSRIEVKVNIVPFTLERNLLVVDDDTTDDQPTSGWNNGGSYPNDAEHDAFWLDMVSEVTGFDPEIDMINTYLGFIPLQTLAQYKSIIWNVYGDVARRTGQPLLYAYIAHRPKNPETAASVSSKVLPNVLALTMAAGGHVMIAGNHPVQNVINRNYGRGVRFPLIFLYELEGKQDGAPVLSPLVGDLSFAYRELCLETMDYSIQNPQRQRGTQLYCRTIQIRPRGPQSEKNDTMREALPADSHFQTMALRPEAAGPGQWYDPNSRGMDVEVYNPAYFRSGSGQPGSCPHVPVNPRSCFQPIYNLGCLDTLEPTYNQPIAFWTTAFANRVADVPGAVAARSVLFGFPPVFFEPEDFRPGMEFILFDEWKLPRGSSVTATSAP